MRQYYLILLLLLTAPMTQAEEAAPLGVPSLPPEPEQAKSLEAEPQVTIIKKDNETIEEVRVNGRLRYIKITPNKGPAYYMIDSDGDGRMDTRRDDLDNPAINQWILKQW